MNDEINPLPGRTTHRMTLDSEEQDRREEEQRMQRQQRQRQKQQRKRRKQEKRRARQEEQKQAKLNAQKIAEQKRLELIKFNDTAKLFQADSDSQAKFSYAEQKIKAMFPKLGGKKDQQSSSEEGQSSQEDQESESQSQSESESNQSQIRREKKARKMAKQRNREQNERRKSTKNINTHRQAGARAEQEKSRKEELVQSLAIRWWYVIPEWPPLDYDYEVQLQKQGYRLIKGKDFRIVDQVVNGLTKVCELDGYRGVFKSKNGIIDVRPAEGKPCISNFNSKSEQQLHNLVKLALQRQIEELQNVEQKSDDEKQLLTELKRQLLSL